MYLILREDFPPVASASEIRVQLAEKGEIAKKVLAPVDPLRAKFIAENFLTDAKLVNEIRRVYAYSGI